MARWDSTGPTRLRAVPQLRQHRNDERRRRPVGLDAAEVVQKRGWLDDKQFLSGYALSQLVPGATNVNLAVFIGTQMRGASGGGGLLLRADGVAGGDRAAAGTLYLPQRGRPAGAWVSGALGGMGAVAIGLNLGTGVRLARRNLRGVDPHRGDRRRDGVDRRFLAFPWCMCWW